MLFQLFSLGNNAKISQFTHQALTKEIIKQSQYHENYVLIILLIYFSQNLQN